MGKPGNLIIARGIAAQIVVVYGEIKPNAES